LGKYSDMSEGAGGGLSVGVGREEDLDDDVVEPNEMQEMLEMMEKKSL
jgi:hypothetical protein